MTTILLAATVVLAVLCWWLFSLWLHERHWHRYYRKDAARWADRYMEISREFGQWMGRNP